MNDIQAIFQVLKNPSVLRQQQHVFLLSHMRCYTSLLGHILGNHPQIQGYYEMHVGYYSWKSLIRQKLLFLKDHPAKPEATIYFDKVLHNEHAMSEHILKRHNVKNLISARPPGESIPSIVKLFEKNRPGHEYCQPSAAAQYYIDRLKQLEKYAQTLSGHFLHVDAENLLNQPEGELEKISQYLQLSSTLDPEYKPMKKTGVQGAGDNSAEMQSGKIVKK